MLAIGVPEPASLVGFDLAPPPHYWRRMAPLIVICPLAALFTLMLQPCPLVHSRIFFANCCQETSFAALPFVALACNNAPMDRGATAEN